MTKARPSNKLHGAPVRLVRRSRPIGVVMPAHVTTRDGLARRIVHLHERRLVGWQRRQRHRLRALPVLDGRQFHRYRTACLMRRGRFASRCMNGRGALMHRVDRTCYAALSQWRESNGTVRDATILDTRLAIRGLPGGERGRTSADRNSLLTRAQGARHAAAKKVDAKFAGCANRRGAAHALPSGARIESGVAGHSRASVDRTRLLRCRNRGCLQRVPGSAGHAAAQSHRAADVCAVARSGRSWGEA